MLPIEKVVSPGSLRDALGIGALVNTRELTVLVVLQVGYGAGIPTGALFRAFVIMALVTTA